MDYEGYLTREEVVNRTEKAFPFVARPSDEEFYVVNENDILRKIIHKNLSKFIEPELPYEGVMVLYDEFSTITWNAVEWMFPSMLRAILKQRDTSDNLHWFLPGYFEKIDIESEKSAYNFSWLSKDQIRALMCILEYISEEYGDSVAFAQENLRTLYKKI